MSEKEVFEIKEEHMRLLKRLNVQWQDCEFGAPEIDPKRPYGNSDVVQDIKEIIHKDGELPKNTCKHCEEDNVVYPFTDEQYTQFHKDMEKVLQIIFVTGTVSKGIYKQEDEYDYESWKKV